MTYFPTKVLFYNLKNQVFIEKITDLKETSQEYKIKIVSNTDN